MKIIIRLLDVESIRGYIDVIRANWYLVYPNAEYGIRVEDIDSYFKKSPIEQEVENWRRWLDEPYPSCKELIAWVDGLVVGMCEAYSAIGDDYNEIGGIYVHPGHWRRGIGTALWRQAEAYLDPTKPIIAKVVTYTEAVKFYEHLGFVDTGERPCDERFVFESGATFPEMVMRRDPTSP